MWSLSGLLNASLFLPAGVLLCKCLFSVLHYKKNMLLWSYGSEWAAPRFMCESFLSRDKMCGQQIQTEYIIFINFYL